MALNISNSGYSSHSWIFIWIFKWVRSPDGGENSGTCPTRWEGGWRGGCETGASGAWRGGETWGGACASKKKEGVWTKASTMKQHQRHTTHHIPEDFQCYPPNKSIDCIGHRVLRNPWNTYTFCSDWAWTQHPYEYTPEDQNWTPDTNSSNCVES